MDATPREGETMNREDQLTSVEQHEHLARIEDNADTIQKLKEELEHEKKYRRLAEEDSTKFVEQRDEIFQQLEKLRNALEFEATWRRRRENEIKSYVSQLERTTKTFCKIVLRVFPHDEPYQAWLTVEAIARTIGLRTAADMNALYGLLGQLENEHRLTRIQLQHGEKLVELFALADKDNETIVRSEPVSEDL